jgi:hypothetical protein
VASSRPARSGRSANERLDLALANSRTGDTLSEHAWAWLGYSGEGGYRRPSGWTRLRRFLLLAGLAWLVVHLLTGGVF